MARTEDSHVAKLESQALPSGDGPAPEVADATIPEAYPAVVVRDEPPALATWRSIALSTNNPIRPLLPQDPKRRSAVVLADAKVVICSSLEAADFANANTSTSDIQGFYLPSGVPVPVHSKAACWVTYTTTDAPSGTTHVSVLIERDDD
jgi:hypothetical protein